MIPAKLSTNYQNDTDSLLHMLTLLPRGSCTTLPAAIPTVSQRPTLGTELYLALRAHIMDAISHSEKAVKLEVQL